MISKIFDTYLCSGSIISKKYVLTAARCFVNKAPVLYSIRSGSSYFDKYGSIHPIRKIKFNQYIDFSGYQHGIALVEVDEPFSFLGTFRKPIKFYEFNDLKENTIVTVSGWDTCSKKNNECFVVRNVSIIDQDNCEIATKIEENMYDHICTAAVDGDCNFDHFGSILTIDGKLAGFSIYGENSGWPIVFSSIRNYINWIEDHLKE